MFLAVLVHSVSQLHCGLGSEYTICKLHTVHVVIAHNTDTNKQWLNYIIQLIFETTKCYELQGFYCIQFSPLTEKQWLIMQNKSIVFFHYHSLAFMYQISLYYCILYYTKQGVGYNFETGSHSIAKVFLQPIIPTWLEIHTYGGGLERYIQKGETQLNWNLVPKEKQTPRMLQK